MVPVQDAETLSDVLGDPDRRDALLMALGQMFDDRYRRELGLAAAVLHASLVSDRLGYDVRTPTLGDGVLRLEVKTDASARGGIRCYLSRNEWETGKRDGMWRLVLCRRVTSGDVAVFGWTDAQTLRSHLPEDTTCGRWQTAELSLPEDVFTPGLPDLNRT